MYFFVFDRHQISKMIEALKSSRFFFIIPEKGQKTSQRPYRQLADFASELGLEVYMIDVKWKKHNSLLECGLEATKKIHEIVDELHPTEINIFGFGIGAMLAAQIGYIFRADSIILCSMPLQKIPLRAPNWPWASSRCLETTNKLMPLLPAGASGKRANTKCTMLLTKSWSPELMKILLPLSL
jgi:hypothetical protein